MIPNVEVVVSANDRLCDWDVLVAAVGYEHRSRHVPLAWADGSRLRIASAFDTHKALSYESNWAALAEHGFDIEEHAEGEIRYWLYKRLLEIETAPNTPLRLAIDVSSFSRSRLAELVLAAAELATTRDVSIDFGYAPAAFMPPAEADTVIEVLGPVVPEFAGWTDEPDTPTTCIIGLGYEPERAVGALEYLEPVGAWAFTPTGVDNRYDRSLERANETVWDANPRPVRIAYGVDQPLWTFVQLESLVFGLKRMTRPVLVPFGPKIFATLCLLAALTHQPETAVWRVSGGQSEEPVDRKAIGPIHHISALFRPRDAAGPS
jgi:hypothetical protein